MGEIINYTRLTTSDKLQDKFVTCQSYIPQDKDQSERGQIFSHLEILSPWFPTNQVGQTIINTLIKEYYRGKESSDLVNFEEAIKKVNESLAQTAQNGETEWIGKLSGVLVLINKGEIHIAQTGKSHCYLYRGTRVNHVTEGLEKDEAPHPLKTFSNLTSGNIQESDKIVIANNTFYEIIHPNELKLIINSLPPALTAIETAKIIQNHGAQDANAIFLESTTRDKLADLLPEQKVEAVYLDQQILTMSAVGKNIIGGISNSISNIFKKSGGNIASFSREKLAPIAKKGLEKTKTHSLTALEKAKQIGSRQEQELTKNDEIVDTQELASDTHSKSGFFNDFKKNFIKHKNKIRRFLIEAGIYTRKKSKLYLALLIAVLIVLSGTIILSYRHKQASAKEQDAKAAFNQIVALSGEADVLMTSDQKTAIEKYNKVISLSDSLKGQKQYTDALGLKEKAQQKIDSVAKLSKLEPSLSAEAKGITSIAIADKRLYAISGSNLYTSDLGAQSQNKIAQLGVEISKLTYLEDEKILVGISKDQVVAFGLDGSNFKPSGQVYNKSLTIKSFGSNIYIADQSQNKLFKLIFSKTDMSEKSEYFKDQTNIAQLIDYAIDGSVYSLSTDGTIARYSRGNKVSDFKISIPSQEAIESYRGIFTSEEASDILVSAKIRGSARILRFRKNGDFIKQYELKSADDIKDVKCNSTNTSIYVLSGEKLLTYQLD